MDKQVSCDGGATWNDIGYGDGAPGDDDATGDEVKGCTGWSGAGVANEIKFRYKARNNGADLTGCVLTDSNGVVLATPVAVGDLPEGFDGFVYETDLLECNAALLAGEPDTATLDCTGATGQVSDEDTATVDACLEPALEVAKECEPEVDPATGQFVYTVTAANPANANGATLVNCVVSDPNTSCDGAVIAGPLAPGQSGSVACLSDDDINTATVTCEIQGAFDAQGQPKTIAAEDSAECLVCELEVVKTCEVIQPPAGNFICDDAKPLDVLVMIWNGTETVDVIAYKGDTGNQVVGEVLGVIPGQEVRISGFAGSPNDVFWEIFLAGTSTKLGESKFHLSCSDDDMDGPEDCGLPQGDGKGTNAGFINDWSLEGLEGNGLALDCTQAPVPPSDTCAASNNPVLCTKRPTVLSMLITGGDCSTSMNTQDPGSWDCTDFLPIDPTQPVQIFAAKKVGDPPYLNMVEVNVGDVVELDPAVVGRDRLDGEMTWQIFQGGLAQEVRVHTSCSQDLATGDKFGGFQIWAFETPNESAQFGVEVVYEYKVTNLSNATAFGISVIDDPNPGDPFEVPGSPIADLDPNEMVTLSSTRLLTETTSNVVTVTGAVGSPNGPTCDAMDDAIVFFEGFVVTKECSERDANGDNAVTITLRNVGSVDLVCDVEDPLANFIQNGVALNAGATVTLDATVSGLTMPELNTVTATCVEAQSGDALPPQTASDLCEVAQVPDFEIAKLCSAQDANGDNAIAITLNNTGEVDLVCDVEDPLANFVANGVVVNAGDQVVLNTSVNGLTSETLNTASATCIEQAGGTTLPTETATDLCEVAVDLLVAKECATAQFNFCPRTPGFWKTHHPEAWPVLSLTIGGVIYNDAELLAFLQYGGPDGSTKLAKHLTATKLNLASGSEPSIQPVVAAADAFLATNPPGSNPQGALLDEALNLKDELDFYNNTDCDFGQHPTTAVSQVTITVENPASSTATLNNCVVNDPLAPDCNTVIPSLAPGDSQTITCQSADLAQGALNTVTVTCDIGSGPETVTREAEDFCEVPVCEVIVDKQVDCGDGFIDVGDVDESCQALAGEPVTIRWLASAGANNTTSLVECVLTDSNGVALGDPFLVGSPIDPSVVDLELTRVTEECSTLFAGGEPDTARLVCGCAGQVDPDFTVEDRDTAAFECIEDSVCLPKLDFNELSTGEIVTEQFAGLGIHVTTSDPVNHPAMIFDSASPTGGDSDLGTPNQDFGGPGVGAGGGFGQEGQNSFPLGNILILSEDGDSTDPDDNANGGTVIFTFDQPVEMTSVGILDIDGLESMGMVTAYDSGGSVLAQGEMQPLGDNSYQDVPVLASGVRRLEVWFPKSGGVASVVFCPEFCAEEAINDPRVQPNTAGHAFYLPGISTEFIFEPAGSFIPNDDDGTATLTGTIRNLFDLSEAFEVDVLLTGRTEVTPAGSPKKELLDSAYSENGGPVDTSTFVYYTGLNGTLTGIDAFEGAVINIVRTGPAFQLGKGANNKNTNFGASSWFDWDVLSQPDDQSIVLQADGQGDINIDLPCECFDLECVPMLSLDKFDQKSYNNNDGPNPWSGPWMEADDNNDGGVETDPTSGYVQVIGQNTSMSWLQSQALRLYGQTNSSIPGGPSAKRSIDLTGKASANLMFDWEAGWYVDDTDEVVVEISSDGTNFTILDSFSWITGSAYGSESYDITPWISANTTVRFRVKKFYGGSDEFFWADNIKITSECEAQVCEVQVDRQVSCDGGVTWVDAGPNGDPLFGDGAIGACSTLDSGPVKVRWLAVNNSTINGQFANLSCTLTDGNPNFANVVAGAQLPPNGTPGVIAMTDINQCFEVEDGEPFGIEAVLTCDCLDASGAVYGTASDEDTAGFECKTPAFTIDKTCEPQNADGVSQVSITVANTGEVNLVCNVTDPLANFSQNGVLVAAGTSTTLNASASGLTQDTLNTATAICTEQLTGLTLPDQSADDLCEVTQECQLVVDKTCEVIEPLLGNFVCDDAKPLDVLTMIWDGTQAVDVVGYEGDPSDPVVDQAFNVQPGDEVSLSGFAGAPNDVYWEIFEAGTNNKLGESKFHRSCSDDEMDGPEDCGLNQGNGKGNDSGFINDWLLEGLEGNGLALNCTPDQTVATDMCTAESNSTLCTKRPTVLSLRLTGDDCSASSNTQDSSKWDCDDFLPIDPNQPVVVHAFKDGDTYLNMVPAEIGDVVDLAAAAIGRSDLHSEATVEIFQGGLAQRVIFHTSCSQDLRTGDHFGGLQIWSYQNSEQGNVQLGVEVVYEYKITNIGDANVADISVVDYPTPGDPFVVDGSPIASLAPDEMVTLSATQLLTETTANEVIVTGHAGTPNGPTCEASDMAVVVFDDDFCEPMTWSHDFEDGTYGGGSGMWLGPWIEDDPTGGDQDPDSGQVRIVGGDLRLDDEPDSGAYPSASRSVNLSGKASATLKFDWHLGWEVDTSDAVVVEISTDGVNFDVLHTFTGYSGSASGWEEFDITDYISPVTTIRFRVTNYYGAAEEFFFVDFVEIHGECAPGAQDSCDDGKPRLLVFEYTGEGCAASDNDQGSSDDCDGDPNGAEPVRIVVTKDDDDVDVTPGDESITVGSLVTFEATGSKLKSNLVFDIKQGSSIVQDLKIHTSCSVPLNVGDQFGGMILRSFEAED